MFYRTDISSYLPNFKMSNAMRISKSTKNSLLQEVAIKPYCWQLFYKIVMISWSFIAKSNTFLKKLIKCYYLVFIVECSVQVSFCWELKGKEVSDVTIVHILVFLVSRWTVGRIGMFFNICNVPMGNHPLIIWAQFNWHNRFGAIKEQINK